MQRPPRPARARVDPELIADQSMFIDDRRESAASSRLRRSGIRGLERSARSTRPPGKDAIDLLVATMTQPFEIWPMLRNEIAEGDREVVELTDGPIPTFCHAAEHASRVDRSAARGPARRCSRPRRRGGSRREGFRTLLVCFNHRSPAMLGEEIAARGGVDRACSRSGRSTSCARTSAARPACCGRSPRRSPQAWWDETLPRALDEAVAELGPRYHAIVVDEGQDFDADWLSRSRRSCSAARRTSCTSSTTRPRRSTAMTSSAASGCPSSSSTRTAATPADPRLRCRRFAGEGLPSSRCGGRPGARADRGRRRRRTTVEALRKVLHRLRVDEGVRPWDIAVLDRRRGWRTRRSGRADAVRERGPLAMPRRRRGADAGARPLSRSAAARRRRSCATRSAGSRASSGRSSSSSSCRRTTRKLERLLYIGAAGRGSTRRDRVAGPVLGAAPMRAGHDAGRATGGRRVGPPGRRCRRRAVRVRARSADRRRSCSARRGRTTSRPGRGATTGR